MRCLVLPAARQQQLPAHQTKNAAVSYAAQQRTSNLTSQILFWTHHGRYHIGYCRKSVASCPPYYITSKRLHASFPLVCHQSHTVDLLHLSGADYSKIQHISRLQKAFHGMKEAGSHELGCVHHQGSIEGLGSCLRQCAVKRDLTTGRRLHSLILACDCEISGFLGGCLIHMFACCGSLLEANVVFSRMRSVCIVAWQAIIEAQILLYHTEIAISFYFRMQTEGLLPSKRIVLCILGACARGREVIFGRIINDDVTRAAQSLDMAVGSCLVDMYAKCNSIAEAQKVFDNLPSRNVVTWNALIAGYATGGEIATVLLLLEKMRKENLFPVGATFLCMLKACIVLRSLETGNLICMEILKFGWDLDAVVGNTLVDMYAKCGCLQEAHEVFKRLQFPDVVSWNVLISGYVKVGDGASALELFWRMQKQGINPDVYTFSCAFQACGSVETGKEGDALHNHLIVIGLDIDTHVGSTLLHMYAMRKKIAEARYVFDAFPNANSVMWGTMIAGYTQQGHHICGLELFQKMKVECMKTDAATFPFILNSCGNIAAISPGMVVHNETLLRHLEADLEICNAIIDMYCKCGCLREAHRVFNCLLLRDVVTWNSLIAGYAQHDDSMTALGLFRKMQQEDIQADKVSLLGALKCCASVGGVLQGMQLHHNVCYDGLEADVLLGSSLVDVYVKLGCLEEADVVFNGLPSLDVVSCSAMISGCVQQGLWFQATNIYDLMVQKSIKPDNIYFACLLKAYCQVGIMSDCERLHDEIIRADLDSDALVGNALIDMYATCGRLAEAHYIFNTLQGRTLVSWNTIMTGYAENDDGFQVLELFELLQREGLDSNKVSYLCVLKACGNLGSLTPGFLIHNQIVNYSLEADSIVGNMIIDTYARCGGLEEAHAVFDSLTNRDVVSWSALIAGYAQHRGLGLAQHYLHNMQQSGVIPVSKTFTSILGACSNGGHVEDGHYYFRLMREEYKITSSIEHCNCMIDLLGRAGCLDDARKFMNSMPILPTIATWMSLLTSCRTFGNIEFGKLCFKEANKLNPYNSSAFMIMSKIYADANMWVEVRNLEEARRQHFAWKKPGKACIEVSGKAHQFTPRDTKLQLLSSMFLKSVFLTRMLKEKGYVPESDSVLETEIDGGEVLGRGLRR